MTRPDGTLTPAQHEILEVIWARGGNGCTVAEIWQQISTQRGVARTTVLNQVDRLEKRRWLRRKKTDTGLRYSAVVSRDDASRLLATDFVNDFFGGSASELVMNLLGDKRLKPSDVDRLREILDEPTDAQEGEQ